MPKRQPVIVDERTDLVQKAMIDLNALIAQPVGNLTGKSPVMLPSGHILHNPAQRTVKSGTEQAKRLVQNAQANATNWEHGVLNPSRSPTQAALEAEGKWKSNMMAAINEGRFGKGIRKTSDEEIKETARKVGAAGYSAGVGARESKIARVFNELQPLQQAVSNTIQAMPQDTESQREARLLAARKAMIDVGKRRRS